MFQGRRPTTTRFGAGEVTSLEAREVMMSGCFDGLGWRASCCPSCCPPHAVCACVPVTNNGLSPPTSLSAFLLRPSPFLVAFALFLGAGPDSVHCMSWAGSVGAQRNHHRTDDLTMPKRIVRYFRRAPHYGVLNYSKPPPRVNDEPSARPSATRDPRHANAPSPPSQPPSVSTITTVRDAPSALDQPVPHAPHRQQLQMPMRLTGTRVLAAVEKDKQLPRVGAVVVVRAYTRQRGLEVRRGEHVRLVLKGARREDEVLRHDGELVEHEVVRGAEVCDEERARGVGEGVWRRRLLAS